ncbi:hypothetical protein SORDD27_00252 [Streptococcus oralis]|uniref:Uncharacterized protein n=1 Tax=Streptococcus oralis TaxID=1303 RepID=A0A139Q0V3_STROR|nr:hypothetical protein SORDD27_00252 [Streptococcus oralis]
MTCKCLLGSKGYFSSFINSICTFTWNCLLFCTIIKRWFDCFINFNSFLNTINFDFSTFKCWCSCLSCTLNICCNNIRTCWSCWFNNWSVFSFYRSSILIYTLNFYTCSFSSKLWFWLKFYHTIIYSISSFAWNDNWLICWFSCFWINKFKTFSFINRNNFFHSINSNPTT